MSDCVITKDKNGKLIVTDLNSYIKIGEWCDENPEIDNWVKGKKQHLPPTPKAT